MVRPTTTKDMLTVEIEQFYDAFDRARSGATDYMAFKAIVEPIARNGIEASWRPIETAPKDGMRILLWDKDISDVDVGCWNGECWVNEDHGLTLVQNQICIPTHWQPLPPPPKSETEEQENKNVRETSPNRSNREG